MDTYIIILLSVIGTILPIGVWLRLWARAERQRRARRSPRNYSDLWQDELARHNLRLERRWVIRPTHDGWAQFWAEVEEHIKRLDGERGEKQA